jgi:hypothetical protein
MAFRGRRIPREQHNWREINDSRPAQISPIIHSRRIPYRESPREFPHVPRHEPHHEPHRVPQHEPRHEPRHAPHRVPQHEPRHEPRHGEYRIVYQPCYMVPVSHLPPVMAPLSHYEAFPSRPIYHAPRHYPPPIITEKKFVEHEESIDGRDLYSPIKTTFDFDDSYFSKPKGSTLETLDDIIAQTAPRHFH